MNEPPVTISPSLLAADPLHFADEVSSVERAGADMHHVDVMDGHFVPNLTFGVPLVKALKKVTSVPLDVHIMVSNPDLVALDYVKAGADILAFPVEAAVHHHRLIQSIQAEGSKAGVAINPGTPLETLEPLLDDLDLINVMSVNPGFGGQAFIERAVERIARLHRMLRERGREGAVSIEVDGGINGEHGPRVAQAGASVLVAGTYIYRAADRAATIQDLKDRCRNARGKDA